jgi:hypothetical protein
MRLYTADEEQRLQLLVDVRAWAAAGLLTAEQRTRVEDGLGVPLRRTGRMLRVGLALFTAIVVIAAVGLALMVLDLDAEAEAGLLAGLAAVGCLAAAEYLVKRFRLYRHGIEETLAVASIVLAGGGGALLLSSSVPSHSTTVAVSVAAILAGWSLLVFMRFGLQYAAVAAMIALAAVPFQLSIGPEARHLLGAAVCAVAMRAARRIGRAHPFDVRGDEARTLQAVAFFGAYLLLNLPVLGALGGGMLRELVPRWFYWATYAATWVVPSVGLALGIRDRDRWLMDAAGAAGLVTLLTNKAYLGWPPETWDPMLLGILLAGAALGVRRWLDRGALGQRGPFTAERLLDTGSDAMRVAGFVSLGVQPTPAVSPAPTPQGFDGGRSGGGGAGAGF